MAEKVALNKMEEKHRENMKRNEQLQIDSVQYVAKPNWIDEVEQEKT